MTTIIMANPSPADPNVQRMVNEGATLQGGNLVWPTGHPKDVSGQTHTGTLTPIGSPGGQATSNAPASPGGTMDLYNTSYILSQQQMQLDYKMNQENQAHDSRMAEIERAFQAQEAQANRAFELQLLNKQIDATAYQAKLDRAQRESEFARQLAFDQERFRHQQELDKITTEFEEQRLELATAAEARQERELRAELSANPTDWIKYQEYMRQLPGSEADTQASAMMGDEELTGISGDPYPADATVAGDDRIRSIANDITGGTGNRTAYNPLLGGTGFAGANIPSPNQFSREHMLSMSDTELQMLAGLLSAGVDMGDGNRVALNPQDFFTQTQNSWMPTLNTQPRGTQYSF